MKKKEREKKQLKRRARAGDRRRTAEHERVKAHNKAVDALLMELKEKYPGAVKKTGGSKCPDCGKRHTTGWKVNTRVMSAEDQKRFFEA